MSLSSMCYARFAAAYVRGFALAHKPFVLPAALLEKHLDELNASETEAILAAGKAHGLKLYRFKRADNPLPRVKRTLGFLRSIEMENLLDVGSGRGAFLWPFMDAFPHVNVTSVDVLPHRVTMLNTVARGGVINLHAVEADFCTLASAERSFDVVTMLEVLEHIPDVAAAVRTASRLARKYIVVTAPSKPDSNPEHIHLLTKDVLTGLFQSAGCSRLHFDGVPGHLLLIAAVGDK